MLAKPVCARESLSKVDANFSLPVCRECNGMSNGAFTCRTVVWKQLEQLAKPAFFLRKQT